MQSETSPLGLIALAGLALVVVAIVLGPKTPLTSSARPQGETPPPPAIAAPTARFLPSSPPTLAPTPTDDTPISASTLTPTSTSALFSNVSFEFFAGWTPDDRSQRIAPRTLWRPLNERVGRSCRIEVVTGSDADRSPTRARVWADCVLLNLGAIQAPRGIA